MVKRQLFFTATILAVCIAFALGILLGWSLSTSKLSEATKILKNTELNTESFLLEQELVKTLGPQGCDLARQRVNELGDQLYHLGNLLSTNSARHDLGVNYDILKRQYHLLQIRTYTLNFRLTENCNSSSPVILFYYTQHSKESSEQGKILDELVNKHGAQVYALEFNYSQDLRFLEEYYNISRAPALVLNYEMIFQTVATKEALENAIAAQKNVSTSQTPTPVQPELTHTD